MSFLWSKLEKLSQRQRTLHDQTCRCHDAPIQNVEVIHYPKVVEALTTPEDWETDLGFVPDIVHSDPIHNHNLKDKKDEMVVYGTVISMSELQEYHNYSFTNFPFQFENL